jgi:LDH2 family malate/lactate/ureidoglycolate dehydrogenase
MKLFTPKQLAEVCVKILEAYGVPAEDAEIVANHLVEANLRGQDGHGVLMLPRYLEQAKKGRIKFGAKVEVVKENACTALLNGNFNFGQVIGEKGMEVAIEKAKKNSVALVGIFNCNHIGMLAHYTMKALKHDMIGVTLCNSAPEVAPFGGRMRKLGTNPLSIAIPAGKEKPIVVDMATSVVAAGKIRAKYAKGESLPEGWIIDEAGLPTVDPKVFMSLKGMLLPFGGYKGFALSLVIDVLGGALTGAGCTSIDLRGANGVIMSAIDVDSFSPIKTFKERVDSLIRLIKNTPTAPGFSEILIPGEPEFRTMEERSKKGIEVDDSTWQAFKALGKEVGLEIE